MAAIPMTASATTHASNGSAGTNHSGDRPSPLVRALDRLFPQARHGAIRDVGTPRCAGHRPSHESRRRHGRLELFLELSHDRAVVRDERRVSEAHAAETWRRTRAAVLADPGLARRVAIVISAIASLKVSRSWVYEHTRSRGTARTERLPYIKIGKYKRFDPRAVREFLQRRSKIA